MAMRRASSSGGGAHRERQQPQARLADHAMSPIGAGCGPQRRMGTLDGLGQHPPPRHLPVVAVPTRSRRRSWRRRSSPAPRATWPGSRWGGSRIPRAQPASPTGPVPQLHPPVRQEVQHCDRLGGAHRVVVGLGHEPHPVAEPQVLGDRGQMSVEDFGIGAVRELLQEVVLPRSTPNGSRPCRPGGLARRPPGRPACSLRSRPGSGHRDLIEHGELHGCSPSRQCGLVTPPRAAALCFPLLFAALTGRSGHGLARRFENIFMFRCLSARPLGWSWACA